MSKENISNNFKIQLLNSTSINTTLGLKYFNNNQSLYLKILKSFVKRNEQLNLKNLNEKDLSNTLHTLKGLTDTLGMESLANIIKQLEQKLDTTLTDNFSQELSFIIQKIKNIV